MVQEALLQTQRSLAIWFDCIGAVVVREAEKKFSTKPGGLFTAIEPIGFIAVIATSRILFNATPTFGDSVLLFYCTGVVPHYAFIWISTHTKVSDLTVTSFPRVQPLDQIIAKGVVEMLFYFGFMIFVFGGLWLVGVSAFALPRHPLTLLAVVEALFLLGLGVGIINTVVGTFFRLWFHIYHVLGRGAMILSGVVFVPDFLPPDVRNWLAWNPILHGVTWFRTAFYEKYPTHILDTGYIIEWAILTLVVGLALERVTRHRRAQH